MGRKNKRVDQDLYLPPIKEEYRPTPLCSKFPLKTVFTTGYRAQVAVDEIIARSDREKTPVRVYECLIAEGGCGFFHVTSQKEHDDFNDYGLASISRRNNHNSYNPDPDWRYSYPATD